MRMLDAERNRCLKSRSTYGSEDRRKKGEMFLNA